MCQHQNDHAMFCLFQFERVNAGTVRVVYLTGPPQILEFTEREIDTKSTTDFFRYINSFVEQQL